MALKTISFGSDVFIPTNVLKSLIASNLYFNLALGFSTCATKTFEPSFNRPNREPVFGQ